MNLKSRIKLNNNTEIPLLGLGTFELQNGDECYNAVRHALDIGYRHIDTAKIYYNEESVGKAIKDSKIDRSEIFVTTKVWTKDLRTNTEKEALEKSLKRLDLDYVDLYLIHWPVKERYIESYKVMEALYASGKARAIGVSNYHIHHLKALLEKCEVVPAVNQVECHPYLTQEELTAFCAENGIVFEPWSPLARGKALGDPVILGIAGKYNKTAAQVVLRWSLQRGFVNIPRSAKPSRVEENADIFDFSLTESEMSAISGLNNGTRVGPHPDNFDF